MKRSLIRLRIGETTIILCLLKEHSEHLPIEWQDYQCGSATGATPKRRAHKAVDERIPFGDSASCH